jgi:hypothetical protein
MIGAMIHNSAGVVKFHNITKMLGHSILKEDVDKIFILDYKYKIG